jgi:DMSO reductase family type II enzyme chaperone
MPKAVSDSPRTTNRSPRSLRKVAPARTPTNAVKALARSRTYLLLSLGFRYPTEETLTAMKEALSGLRVSDLGAASDVALRQHFGDVAQALRRGSLSRMEAEYLKVFTHVIASDCHPCETAYTTTHLFQQAQKLADLNGFYRAFGVEPVSERADHVTVELEFMAFLVQKEAAAFERGRSRRATFVRENERRFLERHLGPWVRAFIRFVEVKSGGSFYSSIGGLARAFFGAEFCELGADVREITGPPKPLPLLVQKEVEDDGDECPAFATAEALQPARGVFETGGGDS